MKHLYKYAKSCLTVLLIHRDGVLDRRKDKNSLLFSHLTVRLNCYSDVTLRFINRICSVNISLGAPGSRHISTVVQEVLSELKSMSPAEWEESSLLSTEKKFKKKEKKSQCCVQAAFGT